MKYLFQVNIGPVQGFIASARRTRDLWFGSALLSRLAMVAASTIKASNANLIFPSPGYVEKGREDKDVSVPNKIIAEIEAEDIIQLGEKVRAAIDNELKDIKGGVYEHIMAAIKDNESLFKRKMADEQIADMIEYRWVALPYDRKDYKDTRKQLESLMAARKNVHNFEPVKWGASEAKSSIDGQLECVIDSSFYPPRKDPAYRFKKQAQLFSAFGAGPSERLSGVDLLKRLGEFKEARDDGFPSTSHIATISYLECSRQLKELAQSKVQEKWDAYIDALQKMKRTEPPLEYVRGYYSEEKESTDLRPKKHPILRDLDGALLFPDHFLDIVADKNELNGPKKMLDAFFEEVEKQLSSDRKLRPQPYYAILQADGDGMGKVIDAQAKHGVVQHQAVSEQIDSFATKARAIVSERLGATIYAGGDDVLALVPIHTAVNCAAELSRQFKELLAGFEDEGGNQPTLSVGIAIVHHLELLSEALKVAHQAEKKAKGYQKQAGTQLLKKDALAVIVSKRSGEQYTIAGRWGDLDSFLGQLIDYYRDEVIPKGTAYELRESALRLRAEHLDLTPKETRTDSEEKTRRQDVLLAEAERILRRKLLVPQGKISNREIAEQALWLLEKRLDIPEDLAKGKRKQTEKPEESIEITSTIEEFVHELVIAEMLADAKRLADTQKREGQK